MHNYIPTLSLASCICKVGKAEKQITLIFFFIQFDVSEYKCGKSSFYENNAGLFFYIDHGNKTI